MVLKIKDALQLACDDYGHPCMDQSVLQVITSALARFNTHV